ncbi:MAG TPA: GDCCVxC domain-containing (seleno)protein [Candidatus Omnitrophota bacterium]|nr:GDCCVxC domain-containing (seleno)protein [Candidatus Omnitrophota bacterium]
MNPIPAKVILKAKIKCPFCGYVKEETMSDDSCQFYYECSNCKKILRPKEGNCCAFCSYADVKCPAKQVLL